MDTLSSRIRAAAKKVGGVEALRKKAGLSGGAFYGLLKGERIKTMRVLHKLQSVGVDVPSSSFRKAA